MADIDLKTETPDATLPSTGFLFGADSQASASPSVYSTQAVATTLLGSTSLTGATETTSKPLLDLSQTWNAGAVTFTGLKANFTDTASAAGSLLMDLQVGGSSRFSVQKNGYAKAVFASISSAANELNLNYYQPGFGVSSTGQFTFSSTANASGPDLYLTRRGAANLRLGAADTGSNTATVTITIATPGVVTWTGHGLTTGTPVFFTTTGALPTGITASTTYYVIAVDANTFQIATTAANAYAGTAVNTSGSQSGTQTGNRNAITQRLSVQSVTGVTDRPGSDIVITGSQGTGTGAGGSIVFQVAPAGSSGTAQNAFQTVLQITGAGGLTGQDGATANTLALRNGTNRQVSRIYSTYTDASNGSWVEISTNLYGADQAGVMRKANGTGTSVTADLYLGSDISGGGIIFRAANTSVWRFSSAGNFESQTDNAYDIGAATANRPRNVFIAGYNQLSEMTAPAAPAANGVRIYAVDNGSGKTQLMALFATGAAQQIAIEP